MGIDQEHLGEIFTQFYRAVDPGYKISGFGLGLSISREIIERHGGTIKVESKKWAGSTFTIKLPKT
ncbi:ATP-binding protein [Niabella hirudinis]|uniref:ATP-binding protein n=1 Tax=Niabella hirudinis TaxID=1285929 RepID=UPI003EB881EE